MKSIKITATVLAITLMTSVTGAIAVSPVTTVVADSKENPVKLVAQNYSAKKPTTAEILKAIYSPSKEFGRLTRKKASEIKILYDLEKTGTSYLKSYSVYITEINPGGREIALFEVKNRKDIKKAQAAARYRQSTVKEAAWYPSEIENATNSKIVTLGNYVLFVADFETDKIVANFKSYYNKKLK